MTSLAIKELINRRTDRITKMAVLVAQSCIDNRTGGCVFICNEQGEELLHIIVGEPEALKIPKYWEFSQEKATRLRLHPEHTWSMQSRDPEKNQYGGAYRSTEGYIVSFSGFSEVDDQIFSALVVYLLDWEYAEDIEEKLDSPEQVARFREMRYLPR